MRQSLLATLIFVLLALTSCGDTAESSLKINEVVPSNIAGCADEAGEKDDWVELANTGSGILSLAGYSLTDDATNPQKFVFGAGVEIAAGGVLLLWADGDTDQGSNHLPFKLNAESETLRLYDPDGVLVDQYTWSSAVADQAFARFPDGTGDFAACASPTCGASNGAACAQ